MAGLAPTTNTELDNPQQFNHPAPTNSEKVHRHPEPTNAGPIVSSNEKPIVGDDPVIHFMGFTGSKLTVAVTFFATIGFSLFGYDQGLMSGIIASAQFNSEFPGTKQSDSSDVYHGTIQGTVTSVYEVGAFLGAVFAYFFGERLGRRKMMLLGAVIMTIGTIIQVTAFGPSLVQFIVGRVITGVGNGMNTATIPSWVAECSKAHNRGFLTCIEASTVAVGTVVAYWVDYGTSFVTDPKMNGFSWRFPTAFQIVFAAILFVGVIFLPESPHWLLAHDREEEAMRICAALNGVGIRDKATIAQKELIMEGIMQHRRAAVQSARAVLQGGKQQNLQRAMVGASSQVFQQIGGCNAVIYYSTILFENQIGLPTQLSLILGGVLSIVYALGALTSFMLVERVGRRPMFLWGTVGQGLAMFIVFGCLLPGSAQAAKGAAFGLYFFIVVFGMTWLPLPWLYPAELNSLSVRTQSNAISTMCNWLFNFLVVQVLPTMTASIGAYTFLLFALANCCFFPVVYFFYPETKGRSLPEIDVLYATSHLQERRPTLIADELPKLNDHQVGVLLERYDIHGGNATDEEAGPQRGDENIDLSIPPAHPEHVSHEASQTSTRVASPTPSVVEGATKKTQAPQ